jgi:hypothetical protein
MDTYCMNAHQKGNQRATRAHTGDISSVQAFPAPLPLPLALAALSFEAGLHGAPRNPGALSRLPYGQRASDELGKPCLRTLAILPLASRIARDDTHGPFVAHACA